MLEKIFYFLIIFSFLFSFRVYCSDYDLHWAKNYIDNAVADKTAYGNPDGNFYPDNNITRAEFISLLVNDRMQSEELKSTSMFTSFNDIKPYSWYFPQIVIAEENDIIQGYSDGGFHPDDILTREDAVVFICRAYKLNPPEDRFFKTYSDCSDISEYAKKYFQFSVNNNITVGYENNTLRPKNPVSRAEAVVMLCKFKGISINKAPEFTQDYPKISPDGTVNNITLEIKTNIPCTIFYKAVKNESMSVYLTPKKEEINNLLAVISDSESVIKADILLNSYDEEYTVFLMPVAEDGTTGTIKRIKDVKALAYETGDGSEKNPYMVYNESQLNHIRYCQDNYFMLANDITLSKEWTPINASGGYFGTLDGNGHTIYNLTVSENSSNAGLFSVLNGGEIKNLAIEGNIKSKNNVGLFAGKLENATVSGCIALGSVYASSSNAGGISGINNGIIENCLSSVNSVFAPVNAGGISGSGSGKIQKSVSAVSSVTADMYAGGISGINSGEISSSVSVNMVTESLLTYNSGRITTNKDGGETLNNYAFEGTETNILNMNSDKNNINGAEILWNDVISKEFYTKNIGSDFFKKWKISAQSDYLLPVPNNFSSVPIEEGNTPYKPIKISSEKNLANISENKHYILSADIYVSSSFTPKAFSGSFDGAEHTIYNLKNFLFSESDGAIRNLKLKNTVNCSVVSSNYGTIENCSVSGNVNISSEKIISFGGISEFNYGIIRNCTVLSNISILSASATAGGITAQNEGFIDNCSFSGKITAKGGTGSSSSLGGIAGFNSEGYIYNCFSKIQTDVKTESAYVGGICGILGSGEIFKCSSDGGLKTNSDNSSYSGGIAAMSSSGLIYSCFSAAKITSFSGSGYSGGICGFNTSANIQGSYSVNTVYQSDKNTLKEKNFFSGGICGFNENGFITDNVAVNPWITAAGKVEKICSGEDEFLSNNYSYKGMIFAEKETPQSGKEMSLKELSNMSFYFTPIYKGGKLGWSSDLYDSDAIWTSSYGSAYSFPLLKGVKNQEDFINPVEFK